jgi:dihydroorotase
VSLSILGARVIDPASGLDQVSDLHISEGRIVAIGAAPTDFTASQSLDATGLVAAPGLVDCASPATAARAPSPAKPAPPPPEV